MNHSTSQDGWSLLPNFGESVTFDDFVHFDDDVEVCGALCDDEILAASNSSNNNEDDDEEESEAEPIPPVTSKEAKSLLCTLRQHLLRTKVDDEVFSALVVIDNALDQARWKLLKQKKSLISLQNKKFK